MTRDYVYIKDVVSAFLKTLSWQGPRRIFNIGSGVGLSLNAILTEIEMLLKMPVARIYEEERKFDVPVNILDITCAQRELDWHPMVTFPEALAATLAWMLKSRSCGGNPARKFD